MTVLVVVEHDNKALSLAVAPTVAAAQKLGGEVHLLVAGFNAGELAQAAAKIEGVTKVLHADAACLENALPENIAKQVLAVKEGYSHILFSATSNGKNIAPRVAALLDVAQVSEVIEVVAPDTFKRFIYAGNALATVQSSDAVKVITVRTSAFEGVEVEGGAAEVKAVDAVTDSGKSSFVSRDLIQTERPELSSARVVIAGGKAFGSKESFEGLLYPLADKLGAALGATRSAIDAGYAPNDWQLGQTGKVVAPELYIAIGISGAVQHTSGVKDSKVIVAINRDPESPIFAIADYGLVGDLFEILPKLTQAL